MTRTDRGVSGGDNDQASDGGREPKAPVNAAQSSRAHHCSPTVGPNRAVHRCADADVCALAAYAPHSGYNVRLCPQCMRFVEKVASHVRCTCQPGIVWCRHCLRELNGEPHRCIYAVFEEHAKMNETKVAVRPKAPPSSWSGALMAEAASRMDTCAKAVASVMPGRKAQSDAIKMQGQQEMCVLERGGLVTRGVDVYLVSAPPASRLHGVVLDSAGTVFKGRWAGMHCFVAYDAFDEACNVVCRIHGHDCGGDMCGLPAPPPHDALALVFQCTEAWMVRCQGDQADVKARLRTEFVKVANV